MSAQDQGVDDPFLPLGIGIIVSGVFGALAFFAPVEPMAWLCIAISAIGGMFVFVGLVGIGVLIGQRAWHRESASRR